MNDIERPGPRNPFPGWDAYQSDSFFSGILIRYARTDWNPNEIDPDFVIVGWYYS